MVAQVCEFKKIVSLAKFTVPFFKKGAAGYRSGNRFPRTLFGIVQLCSLDFEWFNKALLFSWVSVSVHFKNRFWLRLMVFIPLSSFNSYLLFLPEFILYVALLYLQIYTLIIFDWCLLSISYSENLWGRQGLLRYECCFYIIFRELSSSWLS